MKKILLVSATLFINTHPIIAQSNCSNTTKVNICPSVYLAGETNFGKGDDAPAACNIPGEDLVYEIAAPNGAQKIFVSIVNATAPLNLSLELTTCGNGVCNQQVAPAGNSNIIFNVSSANVYYLWIDATPTVTYDISIGGDTGAVWVTIPNTQGNLQFDAGFCAVPVFTAAKPYFQVKYNGIFKTSPMTLSPLGVSGTMCIITYFKNTTGIEAVKKFSFYFPPGGYSSVVPAGILPGFYNTGSWIPAFINGKWVYEFFDAAGTGKGDFTGSSATCLRYEFCFSLIPLSNNPVLTNVQDSIWSDGFGAGYNGWVASGCCPAPTPNCMGTGGVGVGSAHAFGFGFNDPGSPLPVSLINFSAGVVKNKVELSWTTASEFNNDYFTIEKSPDNKDWTAVDKIKGAGNSTTLKIYQSIDQHPFYGISYYRLKQTDFNGAFSYSEIRKINYTAHPNEAIYIYPNPVSDVLKVNSDGSKELTFTFFNSIGEKVLPPVIICDNQSQIKVSQLAPGLYFLVIEEGYKKINKEKIIIQR